MQRCVRKVFDSDGHCWQEIHIYTVLTPAEFDALMEEDAASGCRELRRAMGDLRSGAQLLTEMEQDRCVALWSVQAHVTMIPFGNKVCLFYKADSGRGCAGSCPSDG